MPSPASPLLADPPTPCCICSPSRSEIGVDLSIDDFDTISSRTPMLCDLKPAGRFVATDLHEAGGIPLVAQRLLEANLLHSDAHHGHRQDNRRKKRSTRRKRRTRKWFARSPTRSRPTGGMMILKGNLAAEGCVVKLVGHKKLFFQGPARVFDSEEDTFAAVEDRTIKPGEVVVIRYEGPKGGPGMREMLGVTAAIAGTELAGDSRADHRRTFLRRHPRIERGPRRSGSRVRRRHRSRAQRRHDYVRRRTPRIARAFIRRRN